MCNSVCGRGSSALLLGVSSLPSKPLPLLLLLLPLEETREADVIVHYGGLVSPVNCLSHQLPRWRRGWECALNMLGRKCGCHHGCAAAFRRFRGRRRRSHSVVLSAHVNTLPASTFITGLTPAITLARQECVGAAWTHAHPHTQTEPHVDFFFTRDFGQLPLFLLRFNAGEIRNKPGDL